MSSLSMAAYKMHFWRLSKAKKGPKPCKFWQQSRITCHILGVRKLRDNPVCLKKLGIGAGLYGKSVLYLQLADSLAFSHPIAFSIEAVLLRNEEGFQVDMSIQFKSFFSFALLQKKKALIGGLAHRLFLNKQTKVYFDLVHYIRYLLIFHLIWWLRKILPITFVWKKILLCFQNRWRIKWKQNRFFVSLRLKVSLKNLNKVIEARISLRIVFGMHF